MLRLLLATTLALLLLPIAAAPAAAPAGGTLSDPAAQLRWSGELNGVAPQLPETCLVVTCDEFALKLALPPHAGELQIGVRWADEALDLDLYVYGPGGALVAKSNGLFASTGEAVQLADQPNGDYRVVVSPAFTNGEPMTYEGLAEVEAPVAVEPVRDLLPDLVPLAPRNLAFKTAQYLTDLGLPTNELSSCYPEERIEQGAQRCLRFDQIIANLGQGPFELRYRLDQILTDASLLQRIYRSDGTVHERKADTYEFHPTHAHFHYKNFAQSRLWASNASGDKLGSAPVRTGKKNGFCMIDVEDAWWGRKGDAPRTYYFPRCNVPSEGGGAEQSMINGISPGWADVYNWYLADQFIEVSGVPDGYYVLETVADANNTIVESDEQDNSVQALIRLTGDHAEFVNPLPGQAAATSPAAVRRPRLRVEVRPGRVVAGRRTRLRLKVTALQAGRFQPVAGVRIAAAGHSTRTDRHGIATLPVRPRRAGVLQVRATRPHMLDGAARVRVLRR